MSNIIEYATDAGRGCLDSNQIKDQPLPSLHFNGTLNFKWQACQEGFYFLAHIICVQ